LLKRAASARSFEPSAASSACGFFGRRQDCPCVLHDVELVSFYRTGEFRLRGLGGQTFPQLRCHRLDVARIRPSSFAICRFDRFSPMK